MTTHNPACALVLTNGQSPCNCIKPGPTKAQIDAEARRIHRCPEGYEGPCWGPNQEDRTQAHKNLLRFPVPKMSTTDAVQDNDNGSNTCVS